MFSAHTSAYMKWARTVASPLTKLNQLANPFFHPLNLQGPFSNLGWVFLLSPKNIKHEIDFWCWKCRHFDQSFFFIWFCFPVHVKKKIFVCKSSAVMIKHAQLKWTFKISGCLCSTFLRTTKVRTKNI